MHHFGLRGGPSDKSLRMAFSICVHVRPAGFPNSVPLDKHSYMSAEARANLLNKAKVAHYRAVILAASSPGPG